MKCYTAPSLGGLEGTAEEAWGVKKYHPLRDRNEPTVFFGLYDMRDYLALWFHRGERFVLWCGADIENLASGFVLNDGKLKIVSGLFGGLPKFFMDMLRYDCIHFVEDEDEAEKLKDFGITAKIVPSFLGKISHFPISYKQNDRPNVFISGHEGRQEEYGLSFLKDIAFECRDITFHVYGVNQRYRDYSDNVIWHGKVTKEQFNREIKDYQCGLRLNSHDGFSEISAKSILMGQYPITRLRYPMIPNFNTEDELVALLKALKEMDGPNYLGSDYYRVHLNRFPWVHA